MGSKFAASIISKFYFADFFFLFAAHRLMTQADSVRIIKEEKSIDLIAAFCLIGRTFPIHFALLGRKRKYVKSKTTAKLREKRTSNAAVNVWHLSDPPSFSLPTTFKTIVIDLKVTLMSFKLQNHRSTYVRKTLFHRRCELQRSVFFLCYAPQKQTLLRRCVKYRGIW